MTTATNQLGMRSVLIPFLVEKMVVSFISWAHWKPFKKQTTERKKYNVTNLGHSIHCQQYNMQEMRECVWAWCIFSIILLVGMAISWLYSLHKLMSIPSNMNPWNIIQSILLLYIVRICLIQSNCRLFGMPALNFQLNDVRTKRETNSWYRIIDRKTNWWDVTWPSTDRPTNSM